MSMKSSDIHIGTLSQVSYANKVNIHNKNHMLGPKQVDKTALQNNLTIIEY